MRESACVCELWVMGGKEGGEGGREGGRVIGMEGS